MDPATKQYVTFSAVISGIISFIINFFLMDLVRGTFLYGFPLNLGVSEGIENFILRLINTIIMCAVLTIPTFYILKEMERRR